MKEETGFVESIGLFLIYIYLFGCTVSQPIFWYSYGADGTRHFLDWALFGCIWATVNSFFWPLHLLA